MCDGFFDTLTFKRLYKVFLLGCIAQSNFTYYFYYYIYVENMKPDFKLRVCSRCSRGNPSTKSEAKVVRKSISEKNQQLAEAVAWCNENNARGQAALRTGQFLLIKDRETINRRLDKKIN